MKRFLRPTRRRLLKAWVVVGALAFPTRANVRATPVSVDAATLRLVGVLRHRASARRIGRAYLNEVAPHEACAQRLVDLICGDQFPTRAELPCMDDEALRGALRSQLHRDFKRGRTVKVQGWILSATEARLCALAVVV